MVVGNVVFWVVGGGVVLREPERGQRCGFDMCSKAEKLQAASSEVRLVSLAGAAVPGVLSHNPDELADDLVAAVIGWSQNDMKSPRGGCRETR